MQLSNFRPEFRSGLDGFTKFVLDRTRPKQLGASTMTGPILAGLTQSFLDAINNGTTDLLKRTLILVMIMFTDNFFILLPAWSQWKATVRGTIGFTDHKRTSATGATIGQFFEAY